MIDLTALIKKIDNFLLQAESNYMLVKQSQELSPKEQRRIYDRIRTIERAKQHKRPIMLGRETGRGGWGKYEKPYDYDYNLANFDYLVQLLQDKINTALATVKDKLTRPKVGGDPALKPYVDVLSKAIAKGDAQAKYQALKELKEQTDKIRVRDQDALKKFEKLGRLIPHFRALKDQLKVVSKWINEPLSPTKREHIINMINKSHRLQKLYEDHYTQAYQLDLYFKEALKPLAEITNRLENLINF